MKSKRVFFLSCFNTINSDVGKYEIALVRVLLNYFIRTQHIDITHICDILKIFGWFIFDDFLKKKKNSKSYQFPKIEIIFRDTYLKIYNLG